MKKPVLWTRNFTLLTTATVLGCAGGVASSFALSFLVFEETGSTLAAAFLMAMQLVPRFLVPIVAAPIMDRFPRKPFLVAGDAINGVLYALAGWYLLGSEFSYTLYLAFSLLLSTLGSFDELAYGALYPNLIPEGCEQKGYAVSGTLYPVVNVLMAPVAALLYQKVGVAVILLLQAALSLAASAVESFIRMEEKNRMDGEKFSLHMWHSDLLDAVRYLKGDKGLRSIYSYMAITNGLSMYSPLLVAFFSTTPGLNAVMYSAFSVAEFAGRTLGGVFHYHMEIPRKKRFSFAFFVYLCYNVMDMILLWIPYGAMLINRAAVGFLGVNSASLREAAVQKYIPDEYRAKLNGFFGMLVSLACSVCSLLIGAMGEVMDYRLCITLCGLLGGAACMLTIWRRRDAVRDIYQQEENTQR